MLLVTVVLVLLAGAVLPPGPAAATPPVPTQVAALTGYGWPLPGLPRVGRGFDPPETTYGRGHRGVDLVAAAGSPVLAAGAGTVVHAGPLAGRGVVSVQHPDGLRTTYEPVTATVREGQSLAAGTPLGVLEPGHLGCAAPACLHWGVRRDREYLDPLRLLGRWPVRLLPFTE